MDKKRQKLSEQTADRLYELIMEKRRFPPGSKLPNENDLSRELEVSRTTLREAISFLVAQGILVIARGRGTFVSSELPENGVDMTALAGVRAREKARDLFELRAIFEPSTAALACERASDEELEEIRGYMEAMERQGNSGGDWVAEDHKLHLAINRASHNEYMKKLYPIITEAVDEILQSNTSLKEMFDMAVIDHRTMVEFMLKRDASGAEYAMCVHLKRLMNLL